MHTFTVEVSIPDELRERFDARVQEHGGDQCLYVRKILERDLRAEAPHAGMSFREIFSHASGPSPAGQMTDEELTEFVEAEVKAYRAEKRARAEHGR